MHACINYSENLQGNRWCLMNPKTFACIISLLFLITMTSVTIPEAHSQTKINCDLSHHPCIQSLPECTVTLDINPKPVTAMQDLTFKITLSGKQLEAHPYIDLGMPGMDMGPNRILLKPVGHGVYEGVGVIVRCPSGGRVWKALVTIPDLGKAEFIFEIAQ
jgi:hypothetical protein